MAVDLVDMQLRLTHYSLKVLDIQDFIAIYLQLLCKIIKIWLFAHS
jgi:hypothetical protein